MKQLFGILVMALVVGIAGCASNVEKGDELAQQSKYEEAIKLYEQVKSDDEEYGKAQEGIANCNFQLGEIEFNGKNWYKAIALYEKAATPEANERIASCNFELGEVEFNEKNWKKAIAFFRRSGSKESEKRLQESLTEQENSLYKESIKVGTIPALITFLKQFPNTKREAEVEKRILKLVKMWKDSEKEFQYYRHNGEVKHGYYKSSVESNSTNTTFSKSGFYKHGLKNGVWVGEFRSHRETGIPNLEELLKLDETRFDGNHEYSSVWEKAHFKDGKPHGEWIAESPHPRSATGKTNRRRGNYEHGYKVGKWVEEHHMWETCSEGSYISGKRHGLWTTIYGDRSLQEGLVEQGTYKNGMKHGAWESKYSAITGTFMEHTVEIFDQGKKIETIRCRNYPTDCIAAMSGE